MYVCVIQETPAVDWAVKYLKKGSPLPVEKVSAYGSQILKVRERMGIPF